MKTPDLFEFITVPQLLGLSLSEHRETLLRHMVGFPFSNHQLDLIALVHRPDALERQSIQGEAAFERPWW